MTRTLVVVLLAFLAAAAALIGAPLAALVIGLVATSVIIDSLVPLTGFMRADARNAFQQLVWQRRRETWGKWSRRHQRPGHLELLALEAEQTSRRRHLGVEPLSLDSIIGTVEPERAVAFDHAFRPPSWSRGRWELLWIAWRRGDSLPPISVYRLNGRHFVVDGHHRVSVARSLGAASIDADVIELRPLRDNVGVPPPTLPSAKRHGPAAAHALVRRLLFFAVGLGLALLAGVLGPVPAYVVILASCIFIGRGFGMPDTTGLRHYHQ